MATYRYTTKDLSIATAEAFIRSVTYDATDDNASVYYVMLSNVYPYSDESTPVSPPDTDQYLTYEIQRRGIGAKKVTSGDVSHVITRYNWTSGTVYAMWRDTDVDMYDKNFYVMTDEFNVYKCLYNNKGAQSTSKPSGFATTAVAYADGYTWKYMYTLSLGDANKFLTNEYIPVKFIETSDSSVESTRQLAVQNAAVNGSIEIVETINAGTDYQWLENAAVSSADSLNVTLSNSSEISTTVDYYLGCTAHVTDGTGVGQVRRIVDWSTQTKTFVANTPFSPILDSTSRLNIAPSIIIIGDGSGAKAVSEVSDGGIESITVIDSGKDYTRANALIHSGDFGGGASANVIISPVGGHGANPVKELYGDKVAINVQFDGVIGDPETGKGYIPVAKPDGSDVTFRGISLIKDLKLKVDENNNPISQNPGGVVATKSNSPTSLRLTSRAQVSYTSMNISEGKPVNEIQEQTTLTNNRVVSLAKTGDLEFMTELTSTERNANAVKNALLAANGNVVHTEKDTTVSDNSYYVVYLNNVESYGSHRAFNKKDYFVKSDSPNNVAEIKAWSGPEANTFSGEVMFTENVRPVQRDTGQTEDIKIIIDF